MGRILNLICNSIFQTPIFLEGLEGLTDREGLYEYISRCCDESVDKDWYFTASKFEFVQSRRNLHKEKKLESLCDAIYKTIDNVCDIYQYPRKEYKPEITEMWGNRQKPGTHFKTHAHYNNIFSGVFYLNEDENFPCLKLFRPVESTFDLFKDGYNEFNQGSYSVPTKKDGLVVFPSWLTHCVDTNETDTDRLGISFNVMLRGKFYNTTL